MRAKIQAFFEGGGQVLKSALLLLLLLLLLLNTRDGLIESLYYAHVLDYCAKIGGILLEVSSTYFSDTTCSLSL